MKTQKARLRLTVMITVFGILSLSYLGWAAIQTFTSDALAADIPARIHSFDTTAFLEDSASPESLVELTVYNQDMALVRDKRSFDLESGINQIEFTDVASRIDPTSVLFRSVSDPTGTTVLEQNYEYDIVGTQKLMRKYVDQEIELVTADGSQHQGVLLSGENDVILQKPDGGVTVIRLDQIQQFNFPSLPEGLITRPTLVWLLNAQKTGSQDVEVTYMTGGMNWQADYVVQLNQDDTSLDLNGWITLDNRSGASYQDSKLKLVAGDVNVVRDKMNREMMAFEEAEEPIPMAAPSVEERELFEYHLYDVQRPVTVRDNQTKQIEFTSAANAPVEKFFVYDGGQGLGFYGYFNNDPGYGTYSDPDVNIYLEIENEEDAELGIPLPAGRVRVYKADTDGSLQFVGEDTIDHTPKGETVRLYLGNAFDIVGERRQTNFQQIGDDVIEESFEITIRNHKNDEVEVRVVEHLFRWSEWEITEESAEHSKMDQGTVEWRLQVPADGDANVNYTVRYQF